MSTNRMPRTISKRELGEVLGVWNASGTRIHKRWNKYVTPKFLIEIGLSRKEFTSIRIFNYTQTQAIIKYFKIEASEFN